VAHAQTNVTSMRDVQLPQIVLVLIAMLLHTHVVIVEMVLKTVMRRTRIVVDPVQHVSLTNHVWWMVIVCRMIAILKQ